MLFKSNPYFTLILLIIANLLNYIDRQILYAVFPLVKADLILTDTELGLLGSAFIISYMFSAPIFGWIGDHFVRIKVASTGLILWSLATILSGASSGYKELLLARSVVGIGEASFATVSPVILSDYFQADMRGRIFSSFYLAIPVGSAIGYLLGGILGEHFGWKSAFLITGIPGIILAIPLWFTQEPKRSRSKKFLIQHKKWQNFKMYKTLLTNRSFILNTLAMSSMTFALGGMAQWTPTFIYRMHGLNLAKTNTIFGIITIFSGITGTLTGGWLGDYLQKRTSKGLLIVPICGFLFGIPFTLYALLTTQIAHCLIAIFFAEFFLFLNNGPLNTVIVNVTSSSIRSMAFAVNIFIIHALGDAISPSILGWLSDLWELRDAMLTMPFFILLAAFFSFISSRYIKRDSLLQEG